ncbi:MAG: type 1 glutamine amidotransferase [Ferruginibacter sp.]
MRIHCLQQVAHEGPGTICEWAKQNDHSITYTPFYKADHSLPALADFDVLLVMGGFMNVDEEERFPWLKEEKALIRKSVVAGKKIIGICLGAQLIAAALGSKVYKGKEKEIGIFPVNFTEEALRHALFNHFINPYPVFHWHGDTFDIPAGAVLLASTTVCRNQAYLIGHNVIGLQFHFEMDEAAVDSMLQHEGSALQEKGDFIASKETIHNSYHYLQQNKTDLFMLLDKFLAL